MAIADLIRQIDDAVIPSQVADFTRDVNPVSSSVVGRGISKGILAIGETGSGFLESLSDILGAKGARDFWREKGDQLADLSKNIPVAVESIADIKSLPDAGAYAALAVGQLIPQIALSLGSGLAARAATKGASAIKQLAATVGGAALPSVIQETGGISREIRETSGELRPEIAFPAGLLAGALDTLTPARFLGKVLDTAKDEVKNRTWRSLVRQTFKEIPRTGAVEGLTESAQESIAISANKFADSTYDLVNGQNFLRILDAGLQGMIGGGAIGAVTPAIQRAAQKEVVDTTPRRKEGQAAIGSGLRGTVEFESYDEPTGDWIAEQHPFIISRSTDPQSLPWRITVFGGSQDMPVAIGHVPLKSQDISRNDINSLASQLGRYVRNIALTEAPKRKEGQASLPLQTPEPERFETLQQLLDFRETRRQEEISLYQNQIGLSREQAEKLQRLMANDSGTTKFESSLTDEQRKKMTWLFEESEFNKVDGPFKMWEFNKKFNPEELTEETDPVYLARSMASALDSPVALEPNNDRFVYAVAAAIRLRDIGATQKDLARGVDKYSTNTSSSQGDKEFMFKRSAERLGVFLKSIGVNIPDGGPNAPIPRQITQGDQQQRQGALPPQASLPDDDWSRQKRQQLDADPRFNVEGLAPALRLKSGEIVTELGLRHEELSKKHSGNVDKRGFADKEGNFFNLMEVSRRRMRSLIEEDIKAKKPLLAADVESLGVKPPQGYVKKDRLLVFEQAAPGSAPQAQPAPGLATEIPVDIQTPPTVANTVEELRSKLPQSGLATEHQTLISAFLDTKAVKYLYGMQFAIRDALENGWQGSYLGDLIEIARNSKPDTGPHEFMHRLYDVLPESDQAVIRQARLADIRAQVERGTNSFDLDALSEFERREVRSDEFVAKKFNREVYHLSSDAEYFAGTMSGRFHQKLNAPKDFVSRIKEIVADLWAAIKKSFRLPQTSEQIFRNLMAGRYDVTPTNRTAAQASVRPIIHRKALEQVVRTAAVYNPASIPTEAVMATGQSLDFATQIGNAIQTQVPQEFQRRVGGMLGFGLVDDISNYVAYVLGVVPQNYAQARATLAAHAGAEGLTNTLALHANRGLEIFETRVLKVKKALARQRDKVLKGPAFAAKMRQWANAGVRELAAKSARESLESSLRSGLAQAVERVREAGANEALFEAADTERRFYEGLLDNSNTLTELVRDIAGRVAMTPTGVSIINDADALVQAYLAALPFDQRPRIDRTTGRNERLAMIKVAADLLARNVELRNLQLAAIWSEQTQLKKPVRTIEDQLVRDMTAGKSPSQAIGPLITKLRNLATDEGRAAAVVAAKYKELLKEFNRLTELEQADMVATNVMESPEYRTFRTTVARDAGAEVRPTEAKDIDIGSPFFTQHTVFLPDGTRVKLVMHQDAAGWAETERISTQAADALNLWIHDPVNADSPFRDYYQRQYDTLKAIWHSSMATNPPKQFVFFKDFHFKIFDTWLGLFDGLMRNIGTRATGLPRMASQMWKDSVHQFGNWTAFWKPKLVNVNVKAAKSHPDLWEDNSRGNAVNQWHAEVFTPIVALDDDLNTRLKAGDIVPGYGHVITAEDMEAVRVQLQGASGAMAINVAKGREKITTPTLIEDRFIPGVPFLRQVLKTGTRLIFRRINNTDIAGNYVEEMDKLPEPQRAQAQQAFWDKQWNAVATMIVDRSAEFATIVSFEPAIKAAQQEVTDKNIQNVQQLADFISANGSVTQADALAFILKEMDKHTRAVARYKKNHTDLNAARIETIEAENPFTTNRGARIAPFFWYSYGFKDSASIYNFAASGGSFYFETFLKSLKSLQNDLEIVAADVGTRIKALSQQLGTGQDTRAAGQIRMANVKELELGKETQRYSDLAKHISGLEKYERDIRELYRPGGKAIVDELTIVNRILGPFVAGILFSEYTIMRNAFEGGVLWNGIRLSKIYGSTLKAFPQAFMQLFFNTLKLGYNTVPAVARGATKLHPFRAVATLANTGNILASERDLFGDAVMEVANSLFGKNDLYRALEAAGLALPQYPKEQVGAMAELPWTGGEITAEAYSDVPLFAFLQKMGGGMLTFIDAQMTLFVRPLSPRIGDLLANMTIASSTLKGIQNLEAQARLTFAAYRDAGVPAASLRGRIFSPDQILGTWFGAERTQNEVREIEHWFNDSGVPLHTSLQEYFERLETQGPSAEWLTPEEKMRIVVYAVELSNAATPLNRAPRLKKGTISRLLGLLLGWNTNQYRQVATVLSRSASDPNYSAYQLRLAIGMWFIAVLAFSALGQYGIEEVMRFLAKFVRGEERATRQPTEQEGERAVKAWITYAFNTIPLVSTAVNSAFSDMPNRAAFSPNFLVQAKLIDLGNYVSGAVNSRDPTYRLPQLLKGFVPGASVFLNRLPSTEGSINVMNVSRLYRRYGEPETLRTQRGASGGVGATATPLTPYGERIINAVARKDTAEAIRLKNEAIKIATDMGKPDPERSVEQMILNRLPERRAFQGSISEAQYGTLLSKMTPGERQYVARTSANLGAGLTALGIGLPRLQAPRRGRRGQSRLFAGRRRGLRATRLGRQRRRRRLFA